MKSIRNLNKPPSHGVCKKLRQSFSYSKEKSKLWKKAYQEYSFSGKAQDILLLHSRKQLSCTVAHCLDHGKLSYLHKKLKWKGRGFLSSFQLVSDAESSTESGSSPIIPYKSKIFTLRKNRILLKFYMIHIR